MRSGVPLHDSAAFVDCGQLGAVFAVGGEGPGGGGADGQLADLVEGVCGEQVDLAVAAA